MDYFKRIVKHYIVLALREAGVRIDGDVYAELDDALDSLEPAIRQIVREEIAATNEPDPALADHRALYGGS